MTLVQAIANVTALITAIAADGLTNGVPYVNTAIPGSSHVADELKWPLAADGTPASLVEHICRYTSAHLDAAGMAATQAKVDIPTGVIVAIARLAATRYYGWEEATFTPAEVVKPAAADPAWVVHADNQASVTEALTTWATPAARYMGLFFYNALSFETSNHNHLPAVTKKLAKTTIVLTGLATFIAGNAKRESAIFHDTFHPPTDTMKSNAARNVGAQDHLSALRFDNLRKRIPVKAPDSGVAINFPVLVRKARAYAHNPVDLPAQLAAPARVMDAIAAYQAATTPGDLTAAVAELRALSDALAEPSAYLAGFILGKDAAAAGDADLDLATAKRTNTILGCPAYARAASEFAGSFAEGKRRGFAGVPRNVPDQVLPRVLAAVAGATTVAAPAAAAAAGVAPAAGRAAPPGAPP